MIKIKPLLILLALLLTPSLWADIRIVILGSSTANGQWPIYYTNALKLEGKNNQIINLAQDGYATFNVLPDNLESKYPQYPKIDKDRNITAALRYNPDAIILNLPTNDIDLGATIDVIMSNFNEIVKVAEQKGVDVWVTGAQGRWFHNSEKQSRLIELNDKIISTYKNKSIDFWSDLTAQNGQLLPQYNAGDGIHMNNAAHKILFERVWAKNIHKTNDKGIRLYLAGDATTVEWNMLQSIPMQMKDANPSLYTVDTYLKGSSAVEQDLGFKIYREPSFNGYLFNPGDEDGALEATNKYTEQNPLSWSAAYKWVVPEGKGGMYRLTVDTDKKTLTAQRLDNSTSSVEESLDENFSEITITARDNTIEINPRDVNSKILVEVVSLGGYSIASSKSNGEEISVNNLEKGVYIVKVNYANKTISKKVVVK